jgi:hypothetical protein
MCGRIVVNMCSMMLTAEGHPSKVGPCFLTVCHVCVCVFVDMCTNSYSIRAVVSFPTWEGTVRCHL